MKSSRRRARAALVSMHSSLLRALLSAVILLLALPISAQSSEGSTGLTLDASFPIDSSSSIQHGAEEIESLRTQDSKTYLNPDGSYTAVIGHYLHYETSPGVWEDIDLTLRSEGPSYVMDRHYLKVAVDSSGLSILDQATQDGIHWLTPSPPQVASNRARFHSQSLMWEYAPTKLGVKLAATVPSSQGPTDYSFAYRLEGDAADLTTSPEGSLLSDQFEVPPPIAIGADGVTYPAGPWELLPGHRVGFSFDDSQLPAAAFPYELDPTTQFFSITDGALDGEIYKCDNSFPVPHAADYGTIINDNTGSMFATRQWNPGGPSYCAANMFTAWDEGIPAGSTVVSAAVQVSWTGNYENDDNASLTADWYDFGTVDDSDYSPEPQRTAFNRGLVDVIFFDCPDQTGYGSTNCLHIPLDNTVGIDENGASLRWHISKEFATDTAPTGWNQIEFETLEGTNPEPRLYVTYVHPDEEQPPTCACPNQFVDWASRTYTPAEESAWFGIAAAYQAQRQLGLDDEAELTRRQVSAVEELADEILITWAEQNASPTIKEGYVTATNHYPGLPGLSGHESDYCFRNSGGCLKNRTSRAAAEDWERKAASYYNWGPVRHNSIRDAFRHCAWSAIMTIRASETFALGFGIAHEDGNTQNDQPNWERKMDLFNNTKGRLAGVQGDGVSGINGIAEAHAAELCGDWAEGGDLVTSESEARQL